MKEVRRTIETVIEYPRGEVIHADEFFKRPDFEIWDYRLKCRKSIQNNLAPVLLCDVCLQKVQISGGGHKNKRIPHFAHYKDSKDCPIKTDTNLPKSYILASKFLGQKEGQLHIDTKNLLANFLEFNQEISEIRIEKVQRNIENPYEWRKPDVSALFRSKKTVFEIQLSTTFLDVILDREEYYKKTQTFILWIFREFKTEEDKQRFTQKDIFYSNNRNAFVLDKNAIEASERDKKFYLSCHYQEPYIDARHIVYRWKDKLVGLEDLVFDEKTYKVYYFDVELEEENKKKELESKIATQLIQNFEDKSKIYNIKEESNSDIFEISYNDIFLDFKKNNLEFYDFLNETYYNSPFLNIFRNNYSYPSSIQKEIDALFKSNYQMTKNDKEFLSKSFKGEIQLKYKIKNMQSIIYYLSLAVFYTRLNNDIEDMNKLKSTNVIDLLFTILSFQQNEIFIFQYNWIQLFNHWFNEKSINKYCFAHVIYKSIEVYYTNGINNFISSCDNKKRTIEKKINNYRVRNKRDQCHDYNSLINRIFPKLALNVEIY